MVEAFRGATIGNSLSIARDGVEAMQLLHERMASGRDLPDLVLLDLNLPRKDGREVLNDIKHHERLRHIPVVIVSTSQAERDVTRSYQAGASAVVTKPMDVDSFFRVVAAIETFWLNVAVFARPVPGA